jgi:hypothetical protein
MSNTCLASWTGSRGRLATKRVCHMPRTHAITSQIQTEVLPKFSVGAEKKLATDLRDQHR